MDARLQSRVQRYGWDAASGYYHDAWSAQLRPVHDSLLRMAGIAPGQSIVETACGSGLLTVRLAKHVGPSGRVLATDISQGMLDDLGVRLGDDAIDTVQAARMAADRLAVPDESFDAAVCALGLMYTPDPAAALSEMVRVTAPGGVVAASVWGERRNCGWADVFPVVDARVASEVCPMFFGTGAPEALTRLCKTAGLTDVAEHRQSETLLFASDEDLLQAVLLGGPVALAVKRFSRDAWEEVCHDFLQSVADHKRPNGGYGIPAEFVTVTGRRPRR